MRILTIFLLAVSCQFAHAQWTPMGNDIYFNSSNGKVGIGILPAEKFHVSGGNILTTGSLITSSGIFDANNSSNLSLRTNNTERLMISGTTGQIYIPGNVGIGITPNTTYTLDVFKYGEAKMRLQTQQSGTSSSFEFVAGSVTGLAESNYYGGFRIGTKTAQDFYLISNNTNRLTIKATNGSVGIGKDPNASYMLDVNGAINASQLYLNNVALNLSPSQWTTSGTGLYWNGAGGGVAIGTTSLSAGYKLDVIGGKFRVKNTSAPSPAQLEVDASGVLTTVESTITPSVQGRIGTKGNYNFSVFSNDIDRLTVTADGSVGIGKIPNYKLDVNGSLNASSIFIGGVELNTSGGTSQWTTSSTNIYYNTGNVGIGTGTTAPNAKLQVVGSVNASSYLQNGVALPLPWVKLGANINFTTGIVSIGTTIAPTGYKLAVKGKVIAEEIDVKMQTNWPDYVFDPGYDLMPLYKLQKYINQHKHLPEVPSAEVVKENGISLGEMNATLLKKIEELTLYVLEIKQENDNLKERIEKLESKSGDK